MFFRLISRLSLAALFVAAGFPAFSQVVPAARVGGPPLVVGVGISDFSTDFGPASRWRMEGISAWVDYYPQHLPSFLRGLGVEFVGHDINYNRPAVLPRMRQDTGEGGAIYTWRHFRNFRPYAKYVAGIGSIDFPPYGVYDHDTRSVMSPGGGAEYRVLGNIWVRGDYEYQTWGLLWGSPNHLTPNGFTIGASYDFRHMHRY
jgi:opacity protein-like surface antigen